MKNNKKLIGEGLLLPFILIAILFPLWGFANDITNPMVAAFKNVLLLTNFESSLVQAAFYGGYALMAIPAAIFIKRFSYKSGVLIGLALYAIGCLLFIPSGISMSFIPFLLAYLIMTSGLSFLETTANPYILSMGSPETATRRLNFAQAFNPMGSIIGMFVASMFILVNLNPATESSRRLTDNLIKNDKIIYQSCAESQKNTLKGLVTLTETPDWQTKRSITKKLSDVSTILYFNLDLLGNPRYELAKKTQAELAAIPSQNKFIEAGNAILEVFKIKEPAQPTDTEINRDKFFHGDLSLASGKSSDAKSGNNGLDLALMLGEELTQFKSSSELKAATNIFSQCAIRTKAVSDILDKAYWEHSESNLDTKAINAELNSILTELEIATASISKIKASSNNDYLTKSIEQFKNIQKTDLETIVLPYALMGGLLILVLILFAFKLPKGTLQEGDNKLHLLETLKRLVKNSRYIEGVVAQTFYVGAQIMCWTFIIQYAELELGMAKSTAQNCNIIAMVIFVSSRFICTFILHYINAGLLLALLAIGGATLTLGTIFIEGYTGLYCLIGVSACMSLMFPTIYGIALNGLGDDAKLGSAGLILAIGGGCIMPPLQGWIIDMPPFLFGTFELASVRASFALPAICFIVIIIYGLRSISAKKAS